MNPSEQTEKLLDRLRGSRPDSANGRPSKSNDQTLGELFTLYRERLWRMLTIRLDRRLASRVSPDDVLQETYLDVVASSESMAGQFVSKLTSPSQAAIRHELQARLRSALEEMDPLDREVLALRHFEELGNNEVAQVLGISKDAASKRHVRALKRLRAILADPSGVLPGK